MRVGFDISSLPYGTGVSRYTSNLVRSLVPLLTSQDNLTLFGTSLRQRTALERFIQSLPSTSYLVPRTYPFPPSLTSFLFNQLNMPISTFTGKLDVFHAWDWYTPNPGQTQLTATIHDLALFKHPSTAHQSIREHHQQALQRLHRYNAAIIAVSETTKIDLIEHFSFPPESVTVIPEALPQESAYKPSSQECLAVKRKYGLDKPYFLMVGTQEPRKNHARQIKAWSRYKDTHDLVIVGKKAWADIELQDGIHSLGYLNDHELAALYEEASLFLYVSLYEGFGLPILEAFYHQIPVVTGNLSAMAEVAGDGAALAYPQQVDSIMDSIDQALQYPDKYVKKGIDRLSYFSWSTAAAKTLDHYRKINHKS
jgi:glycosyltransferase involved in cell wall biosynthesis